MSKGSGTTCLEVSGGHSEDAHHGIGKTNQRRSPSPGKARSPFTSFSEPRSSRSALCCGILRKCRMVISAFLHDEQRDRTTPDHSSSALTAKKRPHKLNNQLDLDPRAPVLHTNSSCRAALARRNSRADGSPRVNSRPSSTLRAIRSLLARSKICPVKSPPELMTLIASVDDPAYLADKVVGHLCIQFPEPREPHLGRTT